jgi:hypothetical protein
MHSGARRSCRLRWQWAALLPLCCCLACSKGPALNPVQGKVLYKDQPLKGVVVTFHPKQGADMHTILPVGLTGEDGKFTLSTGQDAGAAAGEYLVTFTCPVDVLPKGAPMTMGMNVDSEDMFKGAYAKSTDSKFVVDVKSGTNQLEAFSLK